ncbi:MAG TPA: WD40 repeat domain-containing serine/threonine-protein kinase [Planctomycetaceae bacterium]|nr:WD40 repeat domain-containing serine/threonine-protein kinase [Planctomycetaceae bacterium]
MTGECLTREAIKALLSGPLLDSDSAAETTHFEQCPACQALAESLMGAICSDLLPSADPERYGRGRTDTECATLVSQSSALECEIDAVNPLTTGVGPHETVGPYRLIEKLGQGGFGVVYRAEQTVPLRRTVALKVIRPGMNSQEVIARFRAERQSLAQMDHPHIARVLDAGTTTDDRPYFVMELVLGPPITRYCDERRLTIRQRLELFVAVCEAVQHAHQKGIIHRDLKPSNILVATFDGQPSVKVIDFGIAKALAGHLSEESAVTSAGQVLGTLPYMSPEQFGRDGGDVDTRSDVYALGVLLCELLTGAPPFDSTRLKRLSLWEAARVVCEEVAPPPSDRLASPGTNLADVARRRDVAPGELVRTVRGDLDWIAAAAIEKDRERRYQSPSELAAEVQRVLRCEPIQACPPTAVYRFRKFVIRNRLWLGLATIVFLSLTLGSGVALWQAQRAETHRLRAEVLLKLALSEADNTRAALYAEQVRRAFSHWQAGDHEQTQILLDNWRPQPDRADPRGFEWLLLSRQLRVPGEQLMQLGSQETIDGEPVTRDVSCVRIAPDGASLAAATDGGLIRRYSLKTNAELPPWTTGLTDVRRLAFNPSGTLLGAISYDAEVVVVETSTGNARLRVPPPPEFDQTTDLEFWNDDRLVVFRGKDILKTYDLPKGILWKTWRLSCPRIFDMALSRQPQLLAFLVDDPSPHHDAVRFFSALYKPDSQPPIYVANGSNVLALSNDAMSFAVGSPRGDIQVWDRITGKLVASSRRPEKISELTFSDDGRQLAIADRTGSVAIWEWRPPPAATDPISMDVDLTGDPPSAAATLAAPSPPPLKAALPIQWQAHRRPARSVQFFADQRHVVSAGKDGRIMRWEWDREPKRRMDRPLHVIAWLPQLQGVAVSGYGPFGLFDLETEAMRSLPESPLLDGDVSYLASNVEGTWLAWLNESAGVCVWHVAENEAPRLLPNSKFGDSELQSLAFVEDAQQLLALGNQHIKAWSLKTTELVDDRTLANPHKLSGLSRDASELYGITNDSVVTYDSRTIGETARLPFDGRDARALAASPREDLLAVGLNREIVLIRRTDGRVLQRLVGHLAGLQQLAFTPDGKTLLALDQRGVLKFWQVKLGVEMLTWPAPQHVHDFSVSPDGRWLAVAYPDVTEFFECERLDVSK